MSRLSKETCLKLGLILVILSLGGSLLVSSRERSAKEEREQSAKSEHRNVLSRLRFAAKQGRVEEVSTLIGKVNPSEPQAKAALSEAVHGGQLRVLKLLLDHGWTLDASELGTAVCYAHIDIMKFLLTKGVDVDAGKEKQHTALHFAAMRKNIVVVKMLLDAGANVDVPVAQRGFPEMLERDNDFARTPLLIAVYHGQAQVVKLLLKHRANAQYKSVRGETALSLAKQSGHPDIIRMLQAAGAKD